jgi:SAM-dependent methyltransferase
VSTLTQEELSLYLRKANRIQSLESMVQEPIDSSVIHQYYKESGVLYRLFHSREGAMHLPIETLDNERHKSKLLFQARSVEQLIFKFGYTSVIELGCGMGFNSIYLARRFPQCQFTAMDTTEANLNIGKKLAGDLPNLVFRKFSFDEDQFEGKADVVFGIETFCYSQNLYQLFRNISGYLNPYGRIVVFDGYVNSHPIRPILSDGEQKAYSMLCWGFALKRFQELDEMRKAIENNQLEIELERDYSQNILPNYRTFQLGSIRFLRFPLLMKILIQMRIIPKTVFRQALAGLFGAHLVERQYMVYYQFVMKKRPVQGTFLAYAIFFAFLHA